MTPIVKTLCFQIKIYIYKLLTLYVEIDKMFCVLIYIYNVENYNILRSNSNLSEFINFVLLK